MSHNSGDPCPACRVARLHVANSEQHGDRQVQYLRCPKCGHRPAGNKVVVAASSIRRRGRVA